MSQRLIPIALLATLLCLGRPEAHGDVGCSSCKESGGSFDNVAGICLPANVEGFQSAPYPPERRAALKAYRNSMAAGYNATPNRLAITVFVYDRESSGEDADRDELRAATNEVLSSHQGARLETGGKSSLPLSGQATDSEGAFFTWQEGGADYASFLWLISRQRRYIKVRATYIRPVGGEREAMQFALDSVHKVVAEVCAVR
jgi:hypothetical protein